MLMKIINSVYSLLSYSSTEYEAVNTFIDNSTFALEIAAVAGIVLLILMNPPLRQRKRFEDRIMFGECVLVITGNLLDLLLLFCDGFEAEWTKYIFYIIPTLRELVFMLIVLQWLIFVDFSLYHSRDHIKRRYRHAVLPVIIVTALDIVSSVLAFSAKGIPDNIKDDAMDGFYWMKFVVEVFYILMAVRMVNEHEKESREPGFLKLRAFIVPFLLGVVFRFYSMAFMAFGIILTYGAVKRRDKYLDHDTGFYNRGFLEYASKYMDHKDINGESGIVISAPGYKSALAGILNDIMDADSTVFVAEEDRFVILTGELRESAIQILADTVVNEAGASKPAFVPEISHARREKDETAISFAGRLLRGENVKALFIDNFANEKTGL